MIGEIMLISVFVIVLFFATFIFTLCITGNIILKQPSIKVEDSYLVKDSVIRTACREKGIVVSASNQNP
jgi:hypothetical protein